MLIGFSIINHPFWAPWNRPFLGVDFPWNKPSIQQARLGYQGYHHETWRSWAPQMYCSSPAGWYFPEATYQEYSYEVFSRMGVPLVIIHFSSRFSIINHPFWGTGKDTSGYGWCHFEAIPASGCDCRPFEGSLIERLLATSVAEGAAAKALDEGDLAPTAACALACSAKEQRPRASTQPLPGTPWSCAICGSHRTTPSGDLWPSARTTRAKQSALPAVASPATQAEKKIPTFGGALRYQYSQVAMAAQVLRTLEADARRAADLLREARYLDRYIYHKSQQFSAVHQLRHQTGGSPPCV